MILRTQEHVADETAIVTYYQLCLSAKETQAWAHKPGASWPCSELAGRSICAAVDQNGLCDFALDGQFADVDGNELSACIADHLPANCRHLWPVWGA